MAAVEAPVRLPERFRALRHIANGGMASVWAAEDRLLGRQVAIKVLAPHLSEDPTSVRRFNREARAAARVSNHRNVVTIFDVAEHDGRPMIVMEHYDGGTVADALRRGRVPRDKAVAWLRATAAGLDAAHAEGIVHRDVKPGNILLDGDGRVAIGDFGIARAAYDQTVTSTGQLLGTAAYLAPEQANGDPATPASDVYALAVVAYELLTGTRPFDGSNFAAQARQHAEDIPAPPSIRNRELPPAVDDVLARGLEKEPSARWPTAIELVHALEQALGDDEAPTTVAAPPPVAAPRRRGLQLLPLILVGLLIAAIAIAAVSGGGGHHRAAAGRKATPVPARHHRPPAHHKAAAKPKPKPPAPSPSPSAKLAALQRQGYALSQQGRYDEAIAILRRVVGAFPPDMYKRCAHPSGQDCFTYAYGLFNLAHALRLSGHPDQAIPLLQERLAIDNQRPAVEAELRAAQAAAGQGAPQPAKPPKPDKHGFKGGPDGKGPPGQLKKQTGE